MSYLFLQCLNEQCRFRFPAPAAEAKALFCPRCRGDAFSITPAMKEQVPPIIFPPDHLILVGLLDNIRSIHNVGSMFRTADGAGVAHLHLAGITATPDNPKLAKAALGAHEAIPWMYHPNGPEAAANLKAGGFQLWALERLNSSGSSFGSFVPQTSSKVALVVGNERAGIDPAILELCDTVLSLPMAGDKSSLNAAVAFGIALYYLRHGSSHEQWLQERRRHDDNR